MVVLLPILWTVILSFQELRLIELRRASLLGDYSVANFSEVFSSNGFWTSLRTTMIYSVLGTAAAVGLGLYASLALRKSFRGRGVVRALMLLPYVTPVVAVTFIWSTMLDPNLAS